MKKIMGFIRFMLVTAFLLAIAGVVLAAEAVAPGVTAPAAAAAPSLVAWFQANQVYVYGALLAISELLGVVPQFQGNGVIDTIIKAIKLLMAKNAPPAA